MATDPNATLYEHEEREAREFVEVPEYIEADVTLGTIAAICEGGCASGAYMPAVTYHQAAQTMGHHGDAVLDALEGAFGEIPDVPKDSGWSGIAVFYLSAAVELWASGVAEEIADALEAEGDADAE